jgi:hypothetical protein
MTDPSARRFDDEEVSVILKRAAEMQEAQSGTSAGMTLADLEEVAREAGLDPALVRRAAADLELTGGRGVEPARAGFLGAPTRLRYERVVDGELAADDYEAVVDEIRRTLDDMGLVSTLGRTLAWRTTPGSGRRQARVREVSVTVVARGGKTGIRVEEAATSLAGGLFGGLMGGLGGGGGGIAMGIGVGVFHSPLAAAGLWAACIAGGYGLARTVFRAAIRERSRTLDGLADRLVAIVDESVRRRGPSSGPNESR